MKTGTPTAQLAYDTILQKPTHGIPSWLIHVMEIGCIETIAGLTPGDYRRNPDDAYIRFQHTIGTCMLDQYLADNPLSMGDHGYEGAAHGATTGAEEIVCDGMRIDSPEAAAEHMEKFVFPALRKRIAEFNERRVIDDILAYERKIGSLLGPTILKVPYGFVSFPGFEYYRYGYVNYFMAYALFPEVMENYFALQADYAVLHNRAVAKAFAEGQLPPLYRLDHDMADSRGTLVSIESLDRIWFPHFARSIEPLLKAGVRLIWHCDGNLMQMVPRLLEVGLHGFQGFQYEDGMDYERICKMKTKDGNTLIIIGGVSVTRALPHGTPDDVKKQLQWLVDHGPRTGLFLGGSSSIAPGTPLKNIETLVEGLTFYRDRGRP